MDKQRIFRALVCFVLICALVMNISPIRAKAVDPVTLTGAAMIGLAACLAAGVVILPQTIELANQFGASFEQQIKDVTIVNVDKDTLWDYYIRMRNKLDNRFSPEWDPGEFHDDLEHALAAGLITAISSIMIAAVATGGFEAPSAEAPEGYAYYNGVLFPEIPEAPSGYSNVVLFSMYGGSQYKCLYTPEPPVVYVSSSGEMAPRKPSSYSGSRFPYYSAFRYPSEEGWREITSDSISSTKTGFSNCSDVTFIWSNYDLIDSKNAEHIILSGSAPTSRATIFVEPDIYVGDIPQKIQDGEDDPEKLNLPPIDPSKIFTTGNTQLDDYTSLVEKLKNGELTYDEFKEQYEYKKNTTTDPSTPSEPVVDPSEPTEPEDVGPIGDYALDLTEFFPFCIPYDIKEFLSLLSAAPEAPEFKWTIYIKSWNWGVDLEIDLSPWDEVAALFRKLELLAFIVGLGFVTREKFLRG